MKKWIESRGRGPYAYGLFLMVIRRINIIGQTKVTVRKQKGRSQIAGMDGGRVTFLILRLGMLSIRLKRVNACRLYKDREILFKRMRMKWMFPFHFLMKFIRF
ncbi:hypothetical protein [Cytobacillus kochii]|uniref:hypothetical protein n=1 Tax=Cytobacillus kochii TaxID=859143 RepID=UPI00259FFE31|nr:hypothetical protein [Cytobacillus kochii]MDM5206027.1 hypothetical protein [Cytobacillus kochii]